MSNYNKILFRKGESDTWSSIDPVLASGEPGYSTNDNILKVGDGANHWNDLPLLFDNIYVSGYGISNYSTKWSSENALSTGIIYDDGNSVGVLTSQPSANLDVSGSFKASSINVNNQYSFPTTDGFADQVLQTDGAGNVVWSDISAGNLIEGTGSLGYVTKWVANNIISTGIIYDNGSNIGIGTLSPSAKLHIRNPNTFQNPNVIIQDSSDLAANVGASIILGGKFNTAGSYGDFAEIKSIKESSANNNASASLAFFTTNVADLNERMRITSSGNVGIGTASPATKLHINSEVLDDGDYSYDTNSLMVVHQTPTSNTTLNDPKDILYLARQGTAAEAFGSAAVFSLSRYENSSANSRTRLDIDLAHGNFLYAKTKVMTMRSDGNVGIGTPSPSEKLDVDGKIKSTLSYTAMHSATNLAVGWYTVAVNAGSRAIGRFGLTCSSGGRHQGIIFYASHFYALGNQISVLHNNRYSASNPIAKLRIKKGGTYDGCLLQVYIDDAINTPEVYLLNDNINTTGWVVVDWVPDGTNPGGVANFAALTQVAEEVDLDTMDFGTTGQTSLDGPVVINEGGNNNDFRVEGDADANLLFTDASTDRVGIGTASPSSKLTVYDDNGFSSFRVESASSYAYSTIIHKSSTQWGYLEFINDAAHRAYVQQNGSNNNNYGGPNSLNIYSYAGPIVFGTNPTLGFVERMRITSSGNVGIGTASPSYKLDVNGTTQILPTAGLDTLYLDRVSGKANIKSTLNQFMIIDSDTNFLALNYYENAPIILGYGGGNVMIGTATAPTSKLQVEGGNVTFNDAGGNFDFRVEGDTDANLLFTDASTDRVGIGTASPSAKLHVNASTATPFLVGDITQAEPFFFTRGGSAFISAGFGRSGAQANCRIQYYSNPVATGNYWIQDADVDSFSLTRAVGDVPDTPIFKLENGAATFNNAFTLPSTDGSSGQTLVTNGSGVVSWSDIASANLTRGSFEVTSTQSTFTVSGGYTLNTLSVYYNGVKLLLGTDFTATNGTTFTLTNAAVNGDIVEYWALNSASSAVGNTSTGSVSVTSNQTVFNVTNGYTVGGLIVFVNGVKLVDGIDFTATNGSSFTLTSAATSGDVVDYIAYGAIVASSNLQKTGDTMTGNLTVNADLLIGSGNSLTIGQGGSDSFTFPTGDGSANQIIETDGSGNLSWVNKPQVVTNVYTGKTTYSVATAGNLGTYIAVLNTSITPTKSSSKIRVELNITFEVTNHQIFRLFRSINGGADTEVVRNDDGNYWSGWAMAGYDSNNSSTPRTNHHIYVDSPNTTLPITYKFMIQSAGDAATTFYLNRSITSAGGNFYENGISQVILTEIPQ